MSQITHVDTPVLQSAMYNSGDLNYFTETLLTFSFEDYCEMMDIPEKIMLEMRDTWWVEQVECYRSISSAQ